MWPVLLLPARAGPDGDGCVCAREGDLVRDLRARAADALPADALLTLDGRPLEPDEPAPGPGSVVRFERRAEGRPVTEEQLAYFMGEVRAIQRERTVDARVAELAGPDSDEAVLRARVAAAVPVEGGPEDPEDPGAAEARRLRLQRLEAAWPGAPRDWDAWAANYDSDEDVEEVQTRLRANLVRKGGGGTDYAGWARWDPAADAEAGAEAEAAADAAAEERSAMRRRVGAVAAAERQRGNAAFRAGDVEAALEAYSAAAQLAPGMAAAWANRAQCLLRLGRPAEAVGDCDRAIAADKGFAKAFVRRAVARRRAAPRSLEEVRLAMADLAQARRLVPDPEAKLHQQAVEELLRAQVEEGKIAGGFYSD